MIHSILLAIVSMLSINFGSGARPGLDWQVGDSCEYKVGLGIVKGKVHMYVREEVPQGFWVNQDVDLGLAGDQLVEILYDKNTGMALKIIVNGKQEDPPDKNSNELIETRNESVKVPLGTFDSIYYKFRNKVEKQDTMAWMNTQKVPINGMIKTISDTSYGKVKLELTKIGTQAYSMPMDYLRDDVRAGSL